MSAEYGPLARLRDLFRGRLTPGSLASSERTEDLVVDVVDSRWEEFMASSQAVLVLGAPGWCGPCQRYQPVIEQLAREFPDVRFGEVDIDKGHHIQAKRAFPRQNTIPLTVLFRDGQKIHSFTGAKPFEQVSGDLRRFFPRSSSTSR